MNDTTGQKATFPTVYGPHAHTYYMKNGELYAAPTWDNGTADFENELAVRDFSDEMAPEVVADLKAALSERASYAEISAVLKQIVVHGDFYGISIECGDMPVDFHTWRARAIAALAIPAGSTVEGA